MITATGAPPSRSPPSSGRNVRPSTGLTLSTSKLVRRDQFRPRARRFSVGPDAQGSEATEGDSGDQLQIVPVVEVGRGDQIFVGGGDGFNEGEFPRIADAGKRMQQDGIDPTEHRAVHRDAQAEREHGDGREPGVAAQHPQSERDVLHDGRHGNIRTRNSHSNRNSLQAHENCLATCPLVGPVCPEVARRVGQTSRSLRMGQGTRIVMKTPPWGRPSACGGLSGRPDELSITYGGFSTVHVSSRTRFWRLEISHPGTAGRRGRRLQGWSCPTRLLSPGSWLWLCLRVTPVPTPPRCTRPPHWLEWTFAQSATWHSSSETVSRKSTSP